MLSCPPISDVLAWHQRVDAGLKVLLQYPLKGVEALMQLGLKYEQ